MISEKMNVISLSAVQIVLQISVKVIEYKGDRVQLFRECRILTCLFYFQQNNYLYHCHIFLNLENDLLSSGIHVSNIYLNKMITSDSLSTFSLSMHF